MSSNAPLYTQAFIAPEFAALFGDEAWLRAMLRFEVSLAQAQATLGIVPQAAAAAIQAHAATWRFDPAELGAQGAHAGSIAVAFVQALMRHIAVSDPQAARFVHYGSTSQDVLDSALALCTRQAVDCMTTLLSRSAAAAHALARRHARVPLLARTLLQPAGVTTVGYKAAQWARALQRTRGRIARSSQAALAVSLGGASGDLAAYGAQGEALRAALAKILALSDPGYCWHTQRDDWLALAADVALACGSMSKIARDLALMGQAEVAEVAEPAAAGRGVSSAMPRKRNPVLSLRVIAASHGVPGLLASLLAAMPQEHERALGLWQAELALWPQVFVHALSATGALAALLEGLVVHADRCRENIQALRGTVFADKVADLLLPILGRAEAQALLGELCRRAQNERCELMPIVLEHCAQEPKLGGVSRHAIEACFDIDSAAQASARLAESLLAEDATLARRGAQRGDAIL